MSKNAALLPSLRRGIADFQKDLQLIRARKSREGSASPIAVALDMSTVALFLLRSSIVLRRSTGRSLGTRAVLKWGFHIDIWTDEIGGGLNLPHPFSIVIGNGVSIGQGCTILHNTTVQHAQCTRIGNGVTLATGCVVLANKNIGDQAICGANSVVSHDIPASCVAVGIPARVLRKSSGSNANA